MSEFTTLLRLEISDGAEASARRNLQKIDALASRFTPNLVGDTLVRSAENIVIEPRCADIGGSGVGGVVQIGTPTHEVDLLLYGTMSGLDSVGLLDQGSGGNKYLRLRYDSTLAGGVDTAADRLLAFDVQAANRSVVLGGNLILGGTFSTAFELALNAPGSASLALPTSGTLATLAGAEVLTNKIIDSDLNAITNIVNADIKATAGILISKLAPGAENEIIKVILGIPTWTTAGSGDVTGPASSTDNALVRFDGVTGKTIQNSAATLSDTATLLLVGSADTFASISPAATPELHLSNIAAAGGAPAFRITGRAIAADGALGRHFFHFNDTITDRIMMRLTLSATTGVASTAAANYALSLSNSAGTLTRAITVHSGLDNVYVGLQAGSTASTGGSRNSGFGGSALLSIQTGTGDDNTAVGNLALRNSVAGSGNTAVGAVAARQLNAASGLVAVGFEAASAVGASANAGAGTNPAQNNTIVGYQSYRLPPTPTVSGNTALNSTLGYQALMGMTQGFQNTAVGASTGAAVTTGSALTLVGYNANSGAALVNAAAFGANAVVALSNTQVFGDVGVSSFLLGSDRTTSGASVVRALRAGDANGANQAAGDLQIQASRSTGTGAAGKILLRGAPADGSGSALNTVQTLLTLDPGTTTAGSTVTVRGQTTQTADVFVVEDGTGTDLFRVTPTGVLVPALTPGSVLFVGTGGTLSQDNANFFWDDTNNRVGLGTTTPSERVHIRATSANLALRLENDLANQSALQFFDNTNGSDSVIYRPAGSTNLVIEASAVVQLTAGGGVGIGTATPAARLHVAGGRTYLQESGSPYALGLGRQDNAGVFYFLGVSTDASPDLVFSNTAGTEQLRVDAATGSLGIGTAAPVFPLHVSTPTGVTRAVVDSYGALGSAIVGRHARGTSAAPTASQLADPISAFTGRGYGATAFASASRGIFQVSAAETWTDTAQGTYLQLYTTAVGGVVTTEKVRVTDAGFVGVGTTTPSKHLDVAGDIAISTVGSGLYIKEGANATMGRSVLVGGTVTVSTTKVTAASEIFLTTNVPGGVVGFIYVSARNAGVDFTITSLSALDTSTVSWVIVEPS